MEKITLETYELLTDAFIKSGSITESAKVAGIGYYTAKRYIEEGTDTYPAIATRIKQLVARATARSDEERLRYLTHFTAAATHLAARLKVIENVDLEPEGVVGVDGRIKVDSRTFQRLAKATATIAELQDKLHHAKNGRTMPQGGNTNVQVNVNIPAHERAREFLRDNPEIYNALNATVTDAEEPIDTRASKEAGVSRGNGAKS